MLAATRVIRVAVASVTLVAAANVIPAAALLSQP
jgi:hypothetical protein